VAALAFTGNLACRHNQQYSGSAVSGWQYSNGLQLAKGMAWLANIAMQRGSWPMASHQLAAAAGRISWL
jgi:hypothetical protein